MDKNVMERNGEDINLSKNFVYVLEKSSQKER
ncbi:hypothetical protein SSUST3_1259 [Streptococcus suis ST3]|nr:hypothetical protein SSU05_1248 [Streptococcus suis 05ZYH33]ABP92421.1 hypothetical protein SSU98_1263 [Streptococcus suis 98HAH33]ADV70285.1 hypothetical protein SSUJS14_1215 [Streptococcus suis JS14]AEB81684.1 hypothetical protein SSUST3_1259 [Streptococcus suis ST3]AER15330.1 hypothetical protein SSU12_1149 [Streptococcus suis SS12]AER17590.1 hypothetical protein SSUD9_1406 [Streptococcus suis D9]AER44420.1 hypothetical protein SSUA7_1098 [Streptococcus suis A7]